jgi:hypothetical protein
MGRLTLSCRLLLVRVSGAVVVIFALAVAGATVALATASAAPSKLLWNKTACGGPPSSPNVECMTYATYGGDSSVVTFSVGPLSKLQPGKRYKVSSFTFWTATKPVSVLPRGVCKAHGTASESSTDPKFHVTKCNLTVAAGSSVQLCVTGGGGNGAGAPNGSVFEWTALLSTGTTVQNVASPVTAVSHCPESVKHK